MRSRRRAGRERRGKRRGRQEGGETSSMSSERFSLISLPPTLSPSRLSSRNLSGLISTASLSGFCFCFFLFWHDQRVAEIKFMIRRSSYYAYSLDDFEFNPFKSGTEMYVQRSVPFCLYLDAKKKRKEIMPTTCLLKCLQLCNGFHCGES